jgi:hypothetical protein
VKKENSNQQDDKVNNRKVVDWRVVALLGRKSGLRNNSTRYQESTEIIAFIYREKAKVKRYLIIPFFLHGRQKGK